MSMSTYVKFDQMGVFGPAVTLLFQPPANAEGLHEVTKLLKTNYLHMSIDHIKVTHRQEFCAYLLQRIDLHKPTTPTKVIRTGFFEKMQCKKLSPLHYRVVNALVPFMLIQAKPFVPAAGITYAEQATINEWLACFLESYISDAQLTDYCDFQEFLGNNPTIATERNAIGFSIYQKTQSGEFNEKDLNALLKGIGKQPGDFLADADHPDEVEDFSKRYIALFALAEPHSQKLSDMIITSLDTLFRKKAFPINKEY